jgi:hypothetical protein
MVRKVFLLFVLLVSVISLCKSQEFFRTADLFQKPDSVRRSGSLNIFQEPETDTLISRYVFANRMLNGMDGFRIEIYRSSDRNAQEESNKKRAEFMIEFPDIISYAMFKKPGYFLVRAGDFRTKAGGTKILFLVRRKFPNAYLVPDVINFPYLNNN